MSFRLIYTGITPFNDYTLPKSQKKKSDTILERHYYNQTIKEHEKLKAHIEQTIVEMINLGGWWDPFWDTIVHKNPRKVNSSSDKKYDGFFGKKGDKYTNLQVVGENYYYCCVKKRDRSNIVGHEIMNTNLNRWNRVFAQFPQYQIEPVESSAPKTNFQNHFHEV